MTRSSLRRLQETVQAYLSKPFVSSFWVREDGCRPSYCLTTRDLMWLCCLVSVLISNGPAANGQPLTFSDMTQASGIRFVHVNGDKTDKKYLFEAKGGGVAFLDYDGDNWLDLYIVQGSTLEKERSNRSPHGALYRNNGDGTFDDVTLAARLVHGGWGMGVTAGDYDNDGFVDLYLANLRVNRLYKNRGDGTFLDVTEKAGVGDSRWSASAAFGDFDRDGDLDLFVANYVDVDLDDLEEPGSAYYCQYRGRPDLCGPMGLKAAPNTLYSNNGDGTFTDVTVKSGVDEANLYYSLGVIWSDLDNDGELDLLVANDSGPNAVYRNLGNGSFEEVGFISGLAASGEGGFQASMGIDAADFDNDGWLDVFMTHFANDYSTLYLNREGILFEDVSGKARLLQPEWLWVSWGTRLVDFDHDGWKDIFHSNGHVYPFLIDAGWSEDYYQPSSLYLNNRDGTFLEVASKSGEGILKKSVGRGVAFGDYDNDGDIDILKANLNDSPQLLKNDLGPGRNWVMFSLRGSKSNRDGLGSRITVSAGGLTQIWEVKRAVGIYSASDPRAHFGLANSGRIEKVTVKWPSGKVQGFTDVAPNAHYLVDESEGLTRQFRRE